METSAAGVPLAWAALAGAVLCAIASFLVWVKFADGTEFKGTDEDALGDRLAGALTLPLSIIAGVFLVIGALTRKRVLHILAAVAAGLAMLMAFGQFGRIEDVNEVFGDGTADPGIGIWLAILGSLVAMVCAIVAAVKTKKRPVGY
jgi:NADH:ubiquinone oxidoreductase subunit 5 (subunit L)/multisubunit Na+/H+ antiporter MnhA subunit